jgi:hypothetical protein
LLGKFILINFDFTIKQNNMTPFQEAIAKVKEGTLQAPSVTMGDTPVNYFDYQLSVHHFNLKIMAKGMKFKGITFTQLKKYYGLKGRGAADCLEQFETIMNDFKKGLL